MINLDPILNSIKPDTIILKGNATIKRGNFRVKLSKKDKLEVYSKQQLKQIAEKSSIVTLQYIRGLVHEILCYNSITTDRGICVSYKDIRLLDANLEIELIKKGFRFI